jgi:hypothetical protein
MCRGCTYSNWKRDYPWLFKEMDKFMEDHTNILTEWDDNGPIKDSHIKEVGSVEWHLIGMYCLLEKERGASK